jgi:hypothetical protein
MSEFIQAFIKGAKETPKGFFAPAIALSITPTNPVTGRR